MSDPPAVHSTQVHGLYLVHLQDDLGRRVVGADEPADVHVRPVLPAVLDLLSNSAGTTQATATRSFKPVCECGRIGITPKMRQ